MLRAKVFSWGQSHSLQDELNEFLYDHELRSDQIISVTQAESRVGDDGGQSFTVTIIYEDSSREASSIPQPIPEAFSPETFSQEVSGFWNHVRENMKNGGEKLRRYRKLSKMAVNKWGVKSQIQQAQEELGELIVALNMYFFRDNSGVSMKDVAGDIADVSIMLSQIRYLIGDQVIDEAIEEKFVRLEKRLEEDE